MLHFISENIAAFLFDKDSDYPLEVYTYGIELMISSLIGMTLIIIIGLITNRLFEAIVYIVTLFAVRSFSGGYHANSYLKCNIIYMTAFVAVFLLNDFILEYLNFAKFYIYGFILLSVLAVLFKFSPVENKNKKIDEKDRKKFKIISIISVLMFSVIAILVNTVIGKNELLIVFPVFCVIEISMLFDILLKKGGTKNEISKGND